MKTRKCFFLFAAAMLCFFAGCGGRSTSVLPAKEPEAASEEAQKILENNTVRQNTAPAIAPADYRVSRMGTFHEGLAWIEFWDDALGKGYQGVIDREGKVLYYYEVLWASEPEFESGYSVAKRTSTLEYYQIDRTGVVVGHYYPSYNSNGDYALACGGGYAVLFESNAGFDVAEEIFRIVDASGKELYRVAKEANSGFDASYLGDGIFAFGRLDAGDPPREFFFAKSGKWLSPDMVNCAEYKDGVLVYFYGCSDDKLILSYADNMGNCTDVEFPVSLEELGYLYQWTTMDIYLSGGMVFINDWNIGSLFAYDTRNEALKRYEGKYAARDGGLGFYPQKNCADGVLAIRLLGEDGYDYAVLLDGALQERSEPVQAMECSVEDGVMYIIASDNIGSTYDLNGHKLLETNYELSNFGEGMMVIRDRNNGKALYYASYNGTASFSDIDFSKARLIPLT